MRLFDIGVRTELRRAHDVEPRFTYYNQSARPSVVVLREMLERWFDRYPKSKKKDLRQRFRSHSDSQHKSAFFELYLHDLLIQPGFDVQVEPDVAHCGTHPDFLARRDGASQFYVEATVARLPSEEESAAEKRMAVVYDAINKLELPNFFLGLELVGAPKTPPSATKLPRDLMRWIDTLDPDAIRERYANNRHSQIPAFVWQHDGWHIIFWPWPKSPLLRGRGAFGQLARKCPKASGSVRTWRLKKRLKLRRRNTET